MDVREKLIELLKQIKYVSLENAANILIGNGVTVQEWISVDDRLPEESGYYLVVADIGRNEVLSYSKKYQAFNTFDDSYSESNVIPVTHWMPLPNPPKGE